MPDLTAMVKIIRNPLTAAARLAAMQLLTPVALPTSSGVAGTCTSAWLRLQNDLAEPWTTRGGRWRIESSPILHRRITNSWQPRSPVQ